MSSKKTVPIAALLTLLIIAILGMIDRWSTADNEGVTSEYQEALATRESGPKLREGDRTEVAATAVHPAPVEAVVARSTAETATGSPAAWATGSVTQPAAESAPDSSAGTWTTIPGTAIPIWPKP